MLRDFYQENGNFLPVTVNSREYSSGNQEGQFYYLLVQPLHKETVIPSVSGQNT